MPTTKIYLLVVVTLVIGGAKTTEATADRYGLKQQLDAAFSHYAFRDNFYGAALGVSYGDRLIYAEGRGFIRGEDAHAGALVPVLGLSKLVTAIAVLRLFEEGRLKLNDRVFGRRGVLRRFRPLGGLIGDERLEEITVVQLLQHRAGWDEHVAPLYDPMLNELYVYRRYNVSNIARAFRPTADNVITHADVIRYVLSRPLQYSPGERASHSNFGYCVLGRIIEVISGQSYSEYVRDNVFIPAGMWRTRIGPSPHEYHQQTKSAPVLESKHNNVLKDEDGDDEDVSKEKTVLPRHLMYKLLRPELLDSTLGIQSTVYDISRLISSLMPTGNQPRLLSKNSVQMLLSRPPGEKRSESWLAMGVKMMADGSFSYESHDPILDVNIYMYHRPYGESRSIRERRDLLSTTASGASVVFFGYSRKHRGHFGGKLAHRLLRYLDGAVDTATLSDCYLHDLSDSHMVVGRKDLLIRYSLDEHHLPAYASAARRAGYRPRWLHGYNHAGHSHYATIFERAENPAQLRFEVHASASDQRAVAFVASHVARGYQLVFLQSFISASHGGRMCHVVVVDDAERDFSTKTKVQFNIGAGLEAYKASLQEAVATGFRPALLSVEALNTTLYVSYLFQRTANVTIGQRRLPTKAYHDLSLEQLEDTIQQSAASGFSLDYLDSYQISSTKQWKFSAVLTQHRDKTPWALQVDVRPSEMAAEAKLWRQRGHAPSLMVAYTHDGAVQLATLWEKVGIR